MPGRPNEPYFGDSRAKVRRLITELFLALDAPADRVAALAKAQKTPVDGNGIYEILGKEASEPLSLVQSQPQSQSSAVLTTSVEPNCSSAVDVFPNDFSRSEPQLLRERHAHGDPERKNSRYKVSTRGRTPSSKKSYNYHTSHPRLSLRPQLCICRSNAYKRYR